MSKAILDGCHYRIDRINHLSYSLPESVIVGARWRNLVNGYIQHKIGVCLHFHSALIPGESELCDLAFVFEQSAADDPYVYKADPFGITQFRRSRSKQPNRCSLRCLSFRAQLPRIPSDLLILNTN